MKVSCLLLLPTNAALGLSLAHAVYEEWMHLPNHTESNATKKQICNWLRGSQAAPDIFSFFRPRHKTISVETRFFLDPNACRNMRIGNYW